MGFGNNYCGRVVVGVGLVDGCAVVNSVPGASLWFLECHRSIVWLAAEHQGSPPLPTPLPFSCAQITFAQLHTILPGVLDSPLYMTSIAASLLKLRHKGVAHSQLLFLAVQSKRSFYFSNASASWDASLGWPADPLWTEANWPSSTPFVSGHTCHTFLAHRWFCMHILSAVPMSCLACPYHCLEGLSGASLRQGLSVVCACIVAASMSEQHVTSQAGQGKVMPRVVMQAMMLCGLLRAYSSRA